MQKPDRQKPAGRDISAAAQRAIPDLDIGRWPNLLIRQCGNDAEDCGRATRSSCLVRITAALHIDQPRVR
jgi:hypothetical protein